ncbi:MAG: hypothetical protein OXU81_21865 [Gammaproteobacteria bacterium]|nr:hypothetical protein [Gammaproteobacteria bacterium]
MTNDELNALTDKAREVIEELPNLRMDWQGDLYAIGSVDPVDPADVLRAVGRARQMAIDVHQKLAAEPRITRTRRQPDPPESTGNPDNQEEGTGLVPPE